MSLLDVATYAPPMLVVLVVFTAILCLSDWVGRRLDPKWDRLPMTPDERHMGDLRQLQAELAATPVDADGRVRKRTSGGGHE